MSSQPQSRRLGSSRDFPIQVTTSHDYKKKLENKLPHGAKKAAKVEKKKSAERRERREEAGVPPSKGKRGGATTKKGGVQYNGYGIVWQDEFVEWLRKDRALRILIYNSVHQGQEYYPVDQNLLENQLYLSDVNVGLFDPTIPATYMQSADIYAPTSCTLPPTPPPTPPLDYELTSPPLGYELTSPPLNYELASPALDYDMMPPDHSYELVNPYTSYVDWGCDGNGVIRASDGLCVDSMSYCNY